MVEPDEVGGVGVVGVADQAPVGELELVYVREIPARERRVDRVRELLEGVGWPDDEHAAWCGVAVDPTPAEEIDLDPQPRPGHRAGSLAAFETGSRSVG